MKSKRLIPALTALMVLYAALFCACPPAHAGAASSDAQMENAKTCHGHAPDAPSEEAPTPGDGHAGCDCSGAAGVVEATPLIPVTASLPLALPPVVPLLERLLAREANRVAGVTPAEEDQRPPGASGSLLRQRCALNL